MTETGIRPLTDSELERRGPNVFRVTIDYLIEVLQWASQVPPATSVMIPLPVRCRLLRLAGCRIGSKVTGLKKCTFESRKVSIGDGSFINIGCWFEGRGTIDIGRNVFLGPQVMIVTSVHEITESGQVSRRSVYRPVRIQDRCWLGARVMVMPGVTIGEGTIIGAGAVVTKDCGPGGVYAGVPARRVR
jgi:maltose O-acetyltransferase